MTLSQNLLEDEEAVRAKDLKLIADFLEIGKDTTKNLGKMEDNI